jgi:membrane protein DedA with SNARE-associated domain
MISTFFNFLYYLETAFNTTNPSGLIILVSLAIITDIGIPVPFVLDTILMFSAYNAWISHDPHWIPVIMIVVMLFIGRQIGSGILFSVSRYFGDSFLNLIVKAFPFVEKGLYYLKNRLNHWSTLVVITGRLTPGFLQVTSIASGAIHMRYRYFALGIAAASLIYDGILILLAFIAAHNPKATDVNFTIWLLIAMVVIVSILWPLIFVTIQRNKKTASKSLNKIG